MQRVHLEAPAAQPAQLSVELAPPEWYYLQAKATAVTPPPSWRVSTDQNAAARRDAVPGLPGSSVIEIDLT